jgi:uncharacterized membrane-anchored protein YitT (DUF2179 family)
MRIFKTISLVIGMYIAAIAMELIMYSNSPTYEGGIAILVILGLLGFMAPKVGYRWFDCFLAIVPIYGIVFIFRIAYRVAFLPQRDWSERVV